MKLTLRLLLPFTSGKMIWTSAILKILNNRWADNSSNSLLMWWLIVSKIDVQCCCGRMWRENKLVEHIRNKMRGKIGKLSFFSIYYMTWINKNDMKLTILPSPFAAFLSRSLFDRTEVERTEWCSRRWCWRGKGCTLSRGKFSSKKLLQI